MAGWLFVAPASASGQVTAGELGELRARLDRLERENQELRAAIQPRPLVVVDAGTDPYRVAALPQMQPDVNEWQIRGIVEEHLRERESPFAAVDAAAFQAPVAGDAAAGSVVGADLSMTARWNNGLEVATKDKAFRIHPGGRWQLDTSWLNADDAVQDNLPGGGAYRDGVDFRRARLRIDGTMYEVIDFACEYDFGNGLRSRNANNTGFQDSNITAVTDLWLQFSRMPIGNLRIGNQKEGIGFEHMVSSRFLPFMERSYNQDTFYGGFFNGFTPGVSLTKNVWDDRGSWNIGVYKPLENVFGFTTNEGDYAVTGRLTALPIYEENGRQLVHLGISGRQATTYDGPIRFRTRDAMRGGLSTQWPVPADVSLLGSTMQHVNAELAAVQGPWTLQAEWLVSLTQNAYELVGGLPVGSQRDNVTYHGGYVQLLYFLTGESETYSFERMAFDRVKPHESFFWVPGDAGSFLGTGAWQVGARYNYLDLNDQGINGGQLHNLTAGLNWFFNPNMKWQFNYIATYRDVSQTRAFPEGSGWIHGWGMRVAQDF
jgi:phosphate-selective porin OprO/OprP